MLSLDNDAKRGHDQVAENLPKGFDYLYELQSAICHEGQDIESAETVTDIAMDCGLDRSAFSIAFEIVCIDQATIESQPRVTSSYGTASVTWSGLITTSDIHRSLSNWRLETDGGAQLSQAQPYSPAVTTEIASQAELTPTPDHTADRSHSHE